MRKQVAVAALLVTGCSIDVENRTAERFRFNPPINRQSFEADVVARGWEVREVDLLVEGRSRPVAMASAGGNRWQIETEAPLCDEFIGYRYAVRYDEPDDTRPPFREQVFPEPGAFRTVQRGQPSECEESRTSVPQLFFASSLEDLPDANPGDGVCASRTNGSEDTCTLRAAVMEANARPGLDAIRLRRARYVLSRTGAEAAGEADASVGDLDITDALSIEGFDAESGCDVNSDDFLTPRLGRREAYRDNGRDGVISQVDGGGIDRVFDIYAAGEGAIVYLECLHVTNGGRQSGANAGGNIWNRATLVTDRVAVTDAEMNSFADGRGVGIYNEGQLFFTESVLTGNVGLARGQVAGGDAGGGLYNERGASADLVRSFVGFNAAARAPGIFNQGGARLLLSNSTVASYSDVSPVNASNDYGANIRNWGAAEIYWSTIVAGESNILGGGGALSIGNSVLRGSSTAPVCTVLRRARSAGNNLVGSGDCVGRPLSTDVVRYAFGVLTPRNNGGFTPTMEIYLVDDGAAISPVDFAEDAAIPPCPRTDQRGFLRPVDGDGDGRPRCDAGAFERLAEQPSS